MKPSIWKHVILRLYDWLIFRPFIGNCKIATTEQTIQYILENKCSVSRYGDGELNMCWKKYDLSFQKYSPELESRMRSILLKKEKNTNHIVCIPQAYNDTSHMTSDAKIFWDNLARKHKFAILPRLPKIQYYDSLCTRCYIDYADKSKCGFFFSLWKKLWEKRNLLIVEGARSKLGIGNNLFDNANNIRRIIVPMKNCFDAYPEIIAAIKKHHTSNELILLAAGPTATVLAYDLATMGYSAVDIGHIDIEYSWYHMQATSKCPVPGKHTNEANSLGDDTCSNEYASQIVQVITPQ